MILLASFLADNARPVYERIAGYLARRLGQPAELLSGVDWEERHRMLDEGGVHVAFMCGLPYSQKFDRPTAPSHSSARLSWRTRATRAGPSTSPTSSCGGTVPSAPSPTCEAAS